MVCFYLGLRCITYPDLKDGGICCKFLSLRTTNAVKICCEIRLGKNSADKFKLVTDLENKMF